MKFVILLISSFILSALCGNYSHSEASLNFMDYCKHYSYPVQIHTINTDDGYLLTFFRIQSKNQTTFKEGLPILWLQHGVLDCSNTWIVNSGPEEDNAPAFFFANRGYDVWLGNSRGNMFSRNHAVLDPDEDDAFWDFTWQDMAEYDLPAGFKYIRLFTNQKITYVGHSQGTTEMWAALSEENPVVKENLKHFIAIAPVAYLGHCESSLLNFLAKKNIILLFKFLRVQEVLSSNWFVRNSGIEICRVANILCKEGLQIIADTDTNLDNYERMDVILGHYPAGANVKTLNHWTQMLKDDTFSKFDYGSSEENMKHYNSSTPPKYNLSKVDVPVSLFVGTKDKLGDYVDARRLRDELTNVPYKFYKEYDKGHGTFVWGKDMSYLDEVESEIKKFI